MNWSAIRIFAIRLRFLRCLRYQSRTYLYPVIFIITLCAGIFAPVSLSAECHGLETEFDSADLAPFTEILSDPSGSLTIDTVGSYFDARPGRNRSLAAGDSVSGLTGGTIWLRFCLQTAGDTAARRLFLEFPDHRVDELAFYSFSGTRQEVRYARSITTGSQSNFRSRHVDYQTFVFDLGIPGAGKTIYYLRLRDAGVTYTGLRLFSEKGFRDYVSRENLLTGLYLGVVAVMFICNLWFYILNRNPTYPGYVLLLFSLAVYVFTESGAAVGVFQGDWPRYNDYLVWIAAITGFVGFTWFSRVFLDTKQSIPRIDGWMHGLTAAGVFAGSLALLNMKSGGLPLWWAGVFVVGIAGLTVLIVMLAFLRVALRRRRRSDVYYALALGCLMVSAALHLLSRVGAIWDPISTRYVFQVASVAAIVLFFMGPGDRIRGLRLEKEAYVESSRLKDAFLASMSHELRTPLNALLGMSDLLDAAALNHEHRGYLEVIRKSGGSMLRMVDSLLDILSIEAGTLILENIPFDLHRVVNSASLAASEICIQKGLGFEVRLQPGLPRGFRGDPIRFKQVLENVLDNAVKFTDSGSVLIEVAAEESSNLKRAGDNQEIQIRITDTGIGIAADRREDIFQSFTRIDESGARRTGGLGVGLSMVRNLVRLMGGRVEVESRSGKGTAFHMTIPLRSAPELFSYERRDAALRAEASESSTDEIPISAHSVSASHGEQPLKILLVEDNRDNRLLFHAYMRSTRCEVDVATNGRRAVEKFKEEAYDIVFMDIQMPEMDGISATREIRFWEEQAFDVGIRSNRVPIYALTAHSLAEEIARSIEAGCDGHITKPVRKQEILQVLHNL